MIGHTKACQEDKVRSGVRLRAFLRSQRLFCRMTAAQTGQCEELKDDEAEEEDEAEDEEAGEEGAEEGGAEESENALLDYPECEWWSCYDKVWHVFTRSLGLLLSHALQTFACTLFHAPHSHAFDPCPALACSLIHAPGPLRA